MTQRQPRCTCIDNKWSCEKHNGDRNKKDPLHYKVPSIGNYCGNGGRSTDSLPKHKRHAEMYPEDVCPTCAIYTLGSPLLEAKEALNPPVQSADPVNKPAHYNAGKVECIDALESATVGLSGIDAVCVGNAIKYLWRHRQKNGTEDLRKAIWYIERLIKARDARGDK